MKKVLALLLAVMMLLVSVSALAEGSKRWEDIPHGDTDDDNVGLKKADDNDKTKKIKDDIIDHGKDGDPIDGLPDWIKDKLPDGFTIINDFDTYLLDGMPDDDDDEVEMIFKFATPYKEGEQVMLAVAIVPPEDEVEWLLWEGTGTEDGGVKVKVSREDLEKISENPFVVIPVSSGE